MQLGSVLRAWIGIAPALLCDRLPYDRLPTKALGALEQVQRLTGQRMRLDYVQTEEQWASCLLSVRGWLAREDQDECELQLRLSWLELDVGLGDWTSDRSHSPAAQERAVKVEIHGVRGEWVRMSLSRRGSSGARAVRANAALCGGVGVSQCTQHLRQQ